MAPLGSKSRDPGLDMTVNINELEARLKAKAKNPEQAMIYLRADEEVPFGSIAKVMDRSKQAGIETINIVTQPWVEGKK